MRTIIAWRRGYFGPVKTKNIISLGKKNDQDDEQKPPRPLKIVLEDKIYRNKVLQNCDKLGEAEDLFKNISVSPDYNKDEREKIRALATEAKKKSEEDLNFVYRVRGPPWNLRLKILQSVNYNQTYKRHKKKHIRR